MKETDRTNASGESVPERPPVRIKHHILLLVIVCAALTAAFVSLRSTPLGKDSVPAIAPRTPPVPLSLPAPSVLPAPPATKDAFAAGWRKDFAPVSAAGENALPEGWKLEGKPGTRRANFSVATDPKDGTTFLHMEADRASASLITGAETVDLRKTPILRWHWRVTTLPDGADGRDRSLDDQAIGIYVGSGSALNNKSVSYRWDTVTPKGSEGNCAYGLGGIKIRWQTLRNKEDAKDGRWITEERDVAVDFKNAWGFIPETIYVSVSSNSQYTGSKAAADLGWIEFGSRPDALTPGKE